MTSTTKKALFIAAGPISWASSRFRCFWPAKYFNADVTVRRDNQFEVDAGYDAYIFQKYGDPGIQAEMLAMGKQVWVDSCDPLWWFSDQSFIRSMYQNATGATFSNEALRDDFMDWYGDDDYLAVTIPDRMEFDHYSGYQKKHWPVRPVRFIWYGVSQNRVALNGAFANLSRLLTMGYNIQLTIFDDRPDLKIKGVPDIPILYTTWEYEKEPAMISGHDIALLPPYPGPWGKVKSNNKQLTAWSCNLPTTDGHDFEEMLQLMDHKERAQMAEIQSLSLEKHWGVELSAEAWEELLNNVDV